MAQLLRVTGIREEGRHGARSQERERPQPFVVDVEMAVEAVGDELASTADYREVIAAVRLVVRGEPCALIETLAERVARAVTGVPGVRSCRATVHKPEGAAGHGASGVSAEATAGSA